MLQHYYFIKRVDGYKEARFSNKKEASDYIYHRCYEVLSISTILNVTSIFCEPLPLINKSYDYLKRDFFA